MPADTAATLPDRAAFPGEEYAHFRTRHFWTRLEGTSMQYDLFSVDDHIIEPPNVWSDRLPAAYAGGRSARGRGRRSPVLGLRGPAGRDDGSQRGGRQGLLGVLDGSGALLRHDPGCYDPVERAKDMLTNGMRGQRVLPDLPALRGRHLPHVRGQGARRPVRAGLQRLRDRRVVRVGARHVRADDHRPAVGPGG